MRIPRVRSPLPIGWLALALAVLLAPLAGCGGDKASEGGAPAASPAGKPTGPRLVIVSNNGAGWWNAVEQGMKEASTRLGCPVELRRPSGSVQSQVERLRDVLSLGDVKGVAVGPVEAEAPGILDAIQALRDAGIVVITIDNDVAPEHAALRRAYIGTANFQAGQQAGRAAKLLKPQGGPVAVFVGTVASSNARARGDGFFDGAGPAFSRSATWEDQVDLGKTLQNVQNAMAQRDDLVVMLGLWAYEAPIIAQELARDAGRRQRTAVVTFDLDEAAVAELEAGNIDASVVQNPYDMGALSVELLKALVEGDEATVARILPDGQTRDTGVRIVVPADDSPLKSLGPNVISIREMKAWLASKGLRSS